MKNCYSAIAKTVARWRFCFLPLLALIGLAAAEAEIAPQLETRLQALLKKDPFTIDEGPLYQAALIEHEELEPLLERLEEITADQPEALAPLWLSASLHWRYGLLEKARERFEKAAELSEAALVKFRLAQLSDASGKPQDAIGHYLAALEADPDDELAERIRLRLALLKSTGEKNDKVETDLAEFAAQRDQVFKNRAAVILALADKPKEALKLYQPGENEKSRFKQWIRMAEWAMEAKDMAQAQEHAWKALAAAKLTRDRRYALTILSESYRRDKKLPDLIQRFAAEENLHDDARLAWIDLLREQGDAEKALALFEETRKSGSAAFTADMRRELLEICREAERYDLLVKNFREMIAEEPRRQEWRTGLSRFYLERGERDKGVAVWDGYETAGETGSTLAAAHAAGDLGLDQVATRFAEAVIADGQATEKLAALQFLFGLHKTRGQEEDMKKILERMDTIAAPDASERAQLAESWEQMGRQDRAAQVLEKLREARGSEDFSSDLETRLAWLYSETGEEEKAFEAWKSAWLRIDSPGRRRYVEDRLMATASRLGNLADIAIELEEKLAGGKADKRDSALLVRLYAKVGDPVSASEIIQDFMKQSGGSEIAMLEEQARVYVMCNDYYHYEKALRRLMELDPEGRPDYLTQLAMSALERGRNDQARAILTEMRALKKNPASSEFEAGVLKIAGMHREAAAAYWRGIAEHPGRIDAYLLLGRTLQSIQKSRQAVGLFQHLVENADKDDLFTVAVDGLLNMNNPREGSTLPKNTLQWVRRAILERLAGNDEQVYLFQLVSDISEELRDQGMMTRAMAEMLPIAGERRTAYLRELMELARGGIGSSGFFRGQSAPKNKEDMLRFGRRLIGIGEAVPPQVYLDLGSSFLDSGDVRNAGKTFDKAEEDSDYGGYQRRVAGTFEQKGYLKSALRSFEKLLIGEFSDVDLVLKVGELKEQMGRDEDAAAAYRGALDRLINGQPLFSVKEKKDRSRNDPFVYHFSRNLEDFEKYYARALTGFLTAAQPDRGYSDLVKDYLPLLESELKRARQEYRTVEGIEIQTLSLEHVPRISRRAALIRRAALAYGDLTTAEKVENLLLEALPEGKGLLPALCRTWQSWGYHRRARRIAERVPKNPGLEEARKVLGITKSGGARDVLHKIVSGDEAGARALLRNVGRLLGDQGSGGEFDSLFAAARYLKDSAAVERLAKHAITKAPKNNKLITCVQMLGRANSCMDPVHRQSLAAFVEGVIQQQLDGLDLQGSRYYLQTLQHLTGKEMKLPIQQIRSQVESCLAQGGYILQHIGSLFNMLDAEQYQVLLREVYRKAKSSDRLAIVLILIANYPGKMREPEEETFLELVSEAVENASASFLMTYRAFVVPRFSSYAQDKDENAAFRARLLAELGTTQPENDRKGLLVEEAHAWNKAGDEDKALDAATRAFRLAIEEEGNLDNQLLSFLPKYTQAFLKVMDDASRANAGSVDHEKKRIALVKQGGDSVQLLETLEAAIDKFPEEISFRGEQQGLLEGMGRYRESIGVLMKLAELEPDKDAHREALQKSWQRLVHPVNAKRYQKPEPKPEAEEVSQAPLLPEPNRIPRQPGRIAVPASPLVVPAAPITATPAPSTPAPSTKPTPKPDETEREKKIQPANVKQIKKHFDAKETNAARVLLRRMWRNFSRNNPSYPGIIYASPPSSTNRFSWPADKNNAPATPPSAVNQSALGGLEAFLSSPVPKTYEESPSPTTEPPSLFTAIGSEPFVIAEIDRWLRTLTNSQYQGAAFEDMVTALATRRIAEQGVERAVSEMLNRAREGSLGNLEKHVLLAVLELQPQAGGNAASDYLEELMRTLDAADQWKALRLARCFAKRGNLKTALTLYRWCGSNVAYSRYVYYGMNALSGNRLVEEIRQQLEGEFRLQALETVLSLMTTDGNDPNTQSYFHDFVLSTWCREVSSTRAYQRCADICRRIIDQFNDPRNRNRNARTLELAVRVLASGGDTDNALRGLRLLLVPAAELNGSGQRVYFSFGGGMVASSSGSGSRRRSPLTTSMLHHWFPANIVEWPGGSAWMKAVATEVARWNAAEMLPSDDAVKILSVVAVRQHQSQLPDDARNTLAALSEMEIPLPSTAVWHSDAARRCGDTILAAKIETALLEKGQLPIVRLPGLIREIADQRGAPVALTIADQAAEYTWHPEFLDAATNVALDANLPETAAVWEQRRVELLQLDDKPERFGFVLGRDDKAKLYRYQELESEIIINDHLDGSPVVLFFAPEERLVKAFARGEREFFREDNRIIDGEGNEWNLSTGMETGGVGVLSPMHLGLVETRIWRAAHPENEVYLLSALDRVKTKLFGKGADDWKYFDELPPAGQWNAPGFDDSAWKTGKAPLGYGEPDIATTLSFGGDEKNKNPSAYFRRQLDIEDPRQLAMLVGRIRADDGAVVYLNGREVYRQNMPEGEIEPRTNASSSAREGRYELALIPPKYLVPGTNTLAVRVHQHDADSSDLYLDLELSVLTKEDLR